MFAITKAGASFRLFCSADVKQQSRCERMLGFGLNFFEGGKAASAELELEASVPAGIVGGFITRTGVVFLCGR